MALPVLSVRARPECHTAVRRVAAALNADPGLAPGLLRACDGNAGRLGHVVRVLRENRASLERDGLKSLAVFGSVARGEDGPDSDLDLAYTLDPKRRGFDLFDLAGIAARIAELVGGRVDLVDRRAPPARLAAALARDAVAVF